MRTMQQFERRAVEKGHTSMMKEAHKFAEELRMSLSLEYPQPSYRSVSDPETEINPLRADVSKNQTLAGNSQKIDFAHTFKFDTLSC